MNNKKDKGIICSLELKNPKVKVLYCCLFIFLCIVSLICLLPPVWILLSSIKDTQEFLSTSPTWLPRSIRISKFFEVWRSTNFTASYLSTFWMVAGDLVFSLVINGLGGYVLSRLKPKGSRVVLAIILWTMMIPASINMVTLFMSFVDVPLLHINITDTYLPMWLMAGANAYYVLLFKSFFDSIPIAYLEAARIDGCTNLGIFWRIILPQSLPIVMTITIFQVNGAWGAFLWPYLLFKKEQLFTVGIKLYALRNALSADKYMMAIIFVIIPPIIVFSCLQKYIMHGFAVGGIKG